MSAPRIHIVESRDKKQVYYNGKPLYSEQQASERIIQRLAHIEIRSHTVVLLFSPVLWIGIIDFLKRCSRSQLVFIIEFDLTLAYFARERIPSIIYDYPNVRVFLPTNDNDIQQALSEVQNSKMRHLETASISGGYRLYHERYRSIIDRFRRLINVEKQNRLTAKYLGRLWIRNLIKNFYFDYRATNVVAYHITGPVIVIGAGCSLDSDIETISLLQHSHTIIAVDTALPVLLTHKITPDMVVVTEAQCYNLRDFIGQIPKEIIIIADMTSHPSSERIANNRYARYLSYFGNVGLLNYLVDQALLPYVVPALGSVGVIAMYLALELSNDNVYTVGFDFCYQLGKSHARSAPFITHYTNRAHRLQPDPLLNLCLQRPYFHVHDRENRPAVSELPLIGYAKQTEQLNSRFERLHEYSTGSIMRPDERYGKLSMSQNKRIAKHVITFNARYSTTNNKLLLKKRRIFISKLREQLTILLNTDHTEADITKLREKIIPLDFLLFDATSSEHSELQTHLHRSAIDYLRYINKLVESA